jgi:diadenosine tetraphosphate (Ap4A) HIT family hydrolase
MQPPTCPFCDQSALICVAESDLAFAVRDKFPVRPLHTLIIPKRHFADVFETTAHEREAIHALAAQCRIVLMQADPSIGGFNFGAKIGKAAEQNIFHAHLHLIPRRAGDTPPPPARPKG